MASLAILSNFCEEQRTQNHPKYLSGLSRALFPTTFPEIAVCKHTRPLFFYHLWPFCGPHPQRFVENDVE